MSTSADAEPPTTETSATASPNQSNHGPADQEKGPRDVRQRPSGEKGDDQYAVTTLDEADDPKARTLGRKWVSVAVIGSASMCAACASSIVRDLDPSPRLWRRTNTLVAFFRRNRSRKLLPCITRGLYPRYLPLRHGFRNCVRQFPVKLYPVLIQSPRPLLVGPLSELYGRRPIYTFSYSLFFAFSFPVAFAPDLGMSRNRQSFQCFSCRFSAVFLIFRFITGMCGAAFLSVAGGSISDLFTNETVAT
jgi:hypothetical protein